MTKLPAIDTSSLTTYFLETMISYAVPSFFWLVVLGFTFKSIKSLRSEQQSKEEVANTKNGLFNENQVMELYDDLYSQSPSSSAMGGGGGGGKLSSLLSFGKKRKDSTLPKNIGIPTRQYLSITKLNDKYASYSYSLNAALQSKSFAASQYRSYEFGNALQKSFGIKNSPITSIDDTTTSTSQQQQQQGNTIFNLSNAQKMDLLIEEKHFLQEGSEIIAAIGEIQYKLTDMAILREMKDLEVDVGEVDPHLKEYIQKSRQEEKDQKKKKKKKRYESSSTSSSNSNSDNTKEDGSNNKGAENIVDAEITETSSNATTYSTTSDDSSSSEESESSSIFKVFTNFAQNREEKKEEMSLNTLEKKLLKEIEKQNSNLVKLELDFICSVIEIMGPEKANGIRLALLGNIDGSSAGSLLKTLKERPLLSILQPSSSSKTTTAIEHDTNNALTAISKNLFVTDFPGDVTASQLDFLREEVTAIIRAAKPGDEALIILQSGGGTVTGYGLAAAQLERFKSAGMKLTVCVEQIAASGGYMMCCVADKIIASPFAILGSIGVIGEIPNFYERLKKEGIEFQTITAGKYKRTLTPTKKVTQEDVEKEQADLENILLLFKSYVKQNRPSLDIDKVATGETWFGKDALDKGLCDEIKTVDDVLSEYVDMGFDVYDIKYDPIDANGGMLEKLLPFGSDDVGFTLSNRGRSKKAVVRAFTNWFVENVMPEIQYMLK
jgi:signal peptide peptidase SppA